MRGGRAVPGRPRRRRRGARGAGEDIAALHGGDDRRRDRLAVERRRELPLLPALLDDPGDPFTQPVEGLVHRLAQLVAGDDVRIHRQPPDRAAAQHIALAQQIRLDALVRRPRPAEYSLGGSPHLRCRAPDRGQREVGLALEVVVHAALPGTRTLQDGLGAGAHVTALPQQLSGGLDQTLRGAHTRTVHTSSYRSRALTEQPERPLVLPGRYPHCRWPYDDPHPWPGPVSRHQPDTSLGR